ncbi:hypothetical protein FACS1894214_5210 [Planctomycetales bacterium]|nr:hypothetical protein FACS1894214_5210 [Planctomycetales bacterium]
MSKNEFQHVRSGEPLVIPAGAYNAMLDAAQAYRNRRMTLAPHGSGFDSLFIHVVNETGKTLQRFDVLGLDSPLETQNVDIFCHQIVFKGVAPQKKHKGKFAVIQQDAAPNQIVRACIYGATVARVQKSSDSQSNSQTSDNTEIKFCDIKEDETSTLTSGGNGAEVLWYDDSQWAIIRIGSGRSTLFPVKLEKTGGEAGDDKKATSWTYKVTDALTDEKLEEDVNPTASPHQWKRPSVGAYSAATFGYAHYDNDNKIVLGWLNEIPEVEVCQ